MEGLIADSHGNVYAADIDNAIIRQISPFGVTTFDFYDKNKNYFKLTCVNLHVNKYL